MRQVQPDAPQPSRRGLLKSMGLLAGGAVAKGLLDAFTQTPSTPPGRSLRIAHLTDIHVQPEDGGARGMIRCLHHVQRLPDLPELILTGGDSIMDSFGQDASRTRELWATWNRVLRDECSLEIAPCIGNHDIWGWNRSCSGTQGDEPLNGKAWAMDGLGLTSRFFSFDRNGWHFIILDSTQKAEQDGRYVARLDEGQFDWLRCDLASTPKTTPILVMSHIPILSAAVFFDGENEQPNGWHVSAALMHTDARRIKDLFRGYPNVKLCLSGHLHLTDRVVYDHVTYLCNGAVCGAWWAGNYQTCPPGYAVVDLFDDGSFESKYLTY